MKELYYVYRKNDGSTGRIAKFADGLYYGYEKGEWVSMPELIKIQEEITDYEEIDKAEAEKLIKEINN